MSENANGDCSENVESRQENEIGILRGIYGKQSLKFKKHLRVFQFHIPHQRLHIFRTISKLEQKKLIIKLKLS